MSEQPPGSEPKQPTQGSPLPPMTPPGAPPPEPPATPPPPPPPPNPGAAPTPGAYQGAEIPSYPPQGYGAAGAPNWGAPAVQPYGAAPYGGPPVPQGMYVDPTSGLPLPQGVQLATPGRRIGAWFLSIVLSVVTLGIGYLVWGAIVWAKGTSPALQVLGMKCWRPQDGRPPGWGVMALRDIIGGIVEAVFFGIGAVVSFVMFLANRDHRSLKDMIASTVVVYDPNKILG